MTPFPSQGRFPETRWTLVLSARDESSRAGQAALAELCELYWQPLYFFVRRRGYGPEEAEDLTQDYFRHLLEKGNLSEPDGSRGRLRSFLLVGLKHFLADQWDKRRALKRGGGVPTLSLDHEAAERRYGTEPADDLSPDVLYEKQWASTVLESILERLRMEQEAAGNARLFEILQPYLGWNASESSYAEAAAQLAISENAARLRVMRLRRRYGELLRECIADTVASEEELVSEMDYLFRIVRR